MDFIYCLPGLGSIMVEVDIFEKYATFMAASADCTADEAARLFMKNVVKYWGRPRAPSISNSFMKRRNAAW